jgi:hypothetical protein
MRVSVQCVLAAKSSIRMMEFGLKRSAGVDNAACDDDCRDEDGFEAAPPPKS